jgi:hypothetical protein
MTMPMDEFIALAAKDDFHNYMGGGNSRVHLYYPSAIYGVSESVLRNAINIKTKVLLKNHYQKNF